MAVTTKAQYQRVEALINRRGPIWQDRMGLGHFEIGNVFLDSFDGEAGDGTDFAVTAVCEVRWNYQQAKVKWYLPSAVRHSDEELESTLVHEYSHVLLAPEQALIDIELEKAARQERGEDFEPLVQQFYERLEMATENTARAIMRGWAAVDSAAATT